jgi:hypothetical protein
MRRYGRDSVIVTFVIELLCDIKINNYENGI